MDNVHYSEIDEIVRNILNDQIADDPSESSDEAKRVWHTAVRKTVRYVYAWIAQDPADLMDTEHHSTILTVYTAYAFDLEQ